MPGFARRRRRSLGTVEAPTLDGLVGESTARLAAWQDARWATRYREVVETVRKAEARAAPGSERLSREAARNLAK